MKRIISLALVFIMASASVFALEKFVDISPDNPYYEAIEYVYDNELMEGCSAERFEPDAYVNRAMVVTVLWRVENCPSYLCVTNFVDVPYRSWYGESVTWAEGEITKGYGEWGTTDYVFKPLDLATKEQLWTMLWRYAEMNKLTELSENVDMSAVADIDKVSDYAIDAVKWGYANGLIKTDENGCIDPKGYISRGEFAAYIKDFVDAFDFEVGIATVDRIKKMQNAVQE